MKFNLFGKISAILITLALLTGCGTAPVKNVDSAMISGGNSITDVEKAINRAGMGLGWSMKKISDGHIQGDLALRSHLAVVDITFNKDSYSIKHKNSTNLKYDGVNIHTNYNGWIENLTKAINIQISTL